MEDFIVLLQQKFEQTLAKHAHTGLPYNSSEIMLTCEVRGQTQEEKLFLQISSPDTQLSLAIPVPYRDEHGNLLVGRRVKRAVGSWHHRAQLLNYWQFLALLLISGPAEIYPELNRRLPLDRLLGSIVNQTSGQVCYQIQQLINRPINDLPLAHTGYEAWAMNQRVVFIDQAFSELAATEKLNYQKQLNRQFFPWTSLGLSDSSMINNYLLKVDLRKYTPFGIKHHNPKRNLYQTLGMRGDETPIILTESAKLLAEQGVERTGWNFLTCFLDLPLTFEDQLIVDLRHLDKFTCEERRFVCFGEVKVALGDDLTEGNILSIEPNGKEIRYWTRTDSSVVSEICDDVIAFNGSERTVKVVTVRTKHFFKEGIKLTNCHGNKGVVVFADCGKMWDAGRQMYQEIDIIVSAKTIAKRRNYGQALEALTTLLSGKDQEIVLSDEAQIDMAGLQQKLLEGGYPAEGCSLACTQWGNYEALCGWVFWGLIKNPEHQLWDRAEVMATDNRQLRTAGLKVSHIELKALITIFGPRNPVIAEILTHQQGVGDVLEMLSCLTVLQGASSELPILPWQAVRPLVAKDVYFHEQSELTDTVVDANLLPQGFALNLPRSYSLFIPDDQQESPQLRVLASGETPDPQAAGQTVHLDKVIAPSQRLRNAWQHQTGLWGMSDVASLLNTIVAVCHRLANQEAGEADLQQALERYFSYLGEKLSTKRGELATYALAIRYPFSAKATATLADPNTLPANTVEIHRSMAETLRVTDGDHIIAERFPCLGFKSLRIQRVQVTDDPACRYVIRVSGNSLVSQNLDFDGDVLFLMSFQTTASKAALAQQFYRPGSLRQAYLDEANSAKQPTTGSISLADVNLTPFPELTADVQAEIVGALTGVKRGTGTTVALAYNLMRIIEGAVGYADEEANLALEVILDKVANSVFSQKHAGVSLEERCRAAICLADLPAMQEMGFPEAGSRRLCQIIKSAAEELGVLDLEKHYSRHQEKGSSNIVNLIVRKRHKVYFATRANLHPVRLMEHLSEPPRDLVAHLWHSHLRKAMEKPSGL